MQQKPLLEGWWFSDTLLITKYWTSDPHVWTLALGPGVQGSGKIAGKVLIVDHLGYSAKLLILLDSVLVWL